MYKRQPFHFGKEKQAGAQDFTACPNGAPGVEERMRILFSEGVMKGRITLPQMVHYLCTNPSRMYGLYPQKGTLLPGSDADLIQMCIRDRRRIAWFYAGKWCRTDCRCSF